jgi:hypothetical protein
MAHPVICFGQQPCGIFPKRFLFAKIVTARRLRQEFGGEVVFFYHDSDHDPRETQTVLRDLHSGRDVTLNFEFANKIQKQYSPLYLKRVLAEWKQKTARQLPAYVPHDLAGKFDSAAGTNVAEFCLDVYRHMGLLEDVRVMRSSDAQFRERAMPIEDYFVDVPFEGEIVRARCRDGKLWLHKGGDRFIEVPCPGYEKKQISPTRDTRFRWMQSVIGCTHYVSGASEQNYINKEDGPGVTFVERDAISDSGRAYIGD